MSGENTPKPWNQIFLGLLAVMVFGGAFFGALNGLPQSVALGAFIAGGALAALAAFGGRVEGPFSWTSDGVRFTIAATEKKLQRGGVQMIAADKVDDATEAIEEAVSQFGTPPSAVGTPTITKSALPPGTSPSGRNIQIVQDAVVALSTLTMNERNQTQAEIARMNRLDFDERSDPRAIRTGDQGRSYRVHKVPGTNIRLWYRPLGGDDPNTLVIMAVEKRG
ncbi:hypothetical protein HA133_05945 [Mycobacteroides chelonae]|uniref:hypothetical protein n=1 Tax=Mycobacteroides chelonae TaxID=1774 RepID=UPI0018B0EB06|nr:hypothetical protein [Mycobacteroides chelonae]MBF9435468.1 hypothetical protein [Mycobacteroides chelonae]